MDGAFAHAPFQILVQPLDLLLSLGSFGLASLQPFRHFIEHAAQFNEFARPVDRSGPGAQVAPCQRLGSRRYRLDRARDEPLFVVPARQPDDDHR